MIQLQRLVMPADDIRRNRCQLDTVRRVDFDHRAAMRSGFERTAIRSGYYRRAEGAPPTDAIVMRRDLSVDVDS